MNHPLRSLAGLALVAAFAIAACGNDAGTTPSASAGPTAPSPGASSSTSPSGSTSSAGPSSPVRPSPSSALVTPHADPALEALLPAEIDGQPLAKLSVDPISSAAGGESIRTLAKAVGDGSGNFSLAYASNPGDPTYNLIALRVPGAESAALAEQFAALLLADTRGAEADEVTLAGKKVTHVTAPGNSIGDSWFYAKADTIFAVQAGSPERAAALLALLP